MSLRAPLKEAIKVRVSLQKELLKKIIFLPIIIYKFKIVIIIIKIYNNKISPA
jgi:hypothetical protein